LAISPDKKLALIQRLRTDPAFRDSLRARISRAGAQAAPETLKLDTLKLSPPDTFASTAPDQTAQVEQPDKGLERLQYLQQRIRDLNETKFLGMPILGTRPEEAKTAFDAAKISAIGGFTGLPVEVNAPEGFMEQHPIASTIGGLAGFVAGMRGAALIPAAVRLVPELPDALYPVHLSLANLCLAIAWQGCHKDCW